MNENLFQIEQAARKAWWTSRQSVNPYDSELEPDEHAAWERGFKVMAR